MDETWNWQPATPNEKEELAQEIAERILKVLEPMGNRIKIPPLFKEYITSQAGSYGGTETYYVAPVGFGPYAMTIHFIFRKDSMSMEFRSPDGTRMMVLELE